MKRALPAQTAISAEKPRVVARGLTIDFLWVSYCICVALSSMFRYTSIIQHSVGVRHIFYYPASPFFILAAEPEKHDEPTEEDLLAELLADERRHHEELEQLEAEMKHLKELEDKYAAQQRENSSSKPKMQPKVGLGNNKSPGIKTKSFDDLDQELRNKEAQLNEAKRKANEDAEKELKKKDAENIALQREAKFQAEMAKVSDEKKKKALLREKQRDTRIVKRILRLSTHERHYDVLGLRCKWGTIRIGPIVFCKTTTADVKRAYRNAARIVHPDKNRDGRAGEAFDALDKSAAILMDDKLKREYDLKLSKKRRDALDKALNNILQIWSKVLRLANWVRILLGPFALPIIIILVLII